MDSGIIVSPTYQNLYQPQRRPPPPLPSEDIPPALPPRNYRKQSAPAATASVNEPGLQARTEECSIDDTKLEFHSLLTQWETHSPREESQYADQLRKQASRRYSEQHRPNAMSMSIIQSRTKINFSTSYKREPMIAQEATQPETTSTTTTTTTSNSLDQSLVAGIKVQNLFLENKNNNTNLESAQKSLQNSKFITESQDKRESTLSEMSLPSPPLSTEELKSDEELPPPPPPPPGIIEHPRESNEDGQIEKFADDSYGAFVSRSRREVGTYKRSVSAATLNSDNNNYKLSTAASSQFGDKPLGKHSWNSDSALSQPGSLLHPYRDSSEGSSLKSSREGLENAPLKSVRESNDEAQLKSELNDGSHLKYTREPTDRSHLRGYRESNDNGSHLKSTRASNDGSHLRMNRESNDGSQLKVNTELNGGSQLMIGRTSTEGSQLRSSRDFQDSSCLWSSRRFDDISQYRFNNKEVHEGSQLNDGSQGQSRRNSHDSRETKGCGPCEPSGSVPTFKVESSNVRTGVKSSAQVLQSPMAGGIRPNIVYSPRPFVIDKSSPVSKNERTGNKTPCSVKDKIFRLEKESVRTVGSPSGASTNSGSSANHPLDLPNSSEPIRTSSPKLSAGQLSSNSSWKTQENLCSPANSINSDSQRILDSWEEDRQKKKVNPNSERKISSGDASELASAQQRNKDKSAFMSNKTHGQEQLGDQRTSSQCRYSEQSQCTQNLRSDLDSSVSSSDSGIDRTQDLGTEKGQRLFNNHTNQRLNDCSMKQSSGMNYSQREPKNHRAGPDAYSVQGSKDNFSPNRNQVQFMQKSSDYKRNQRDLDNVGIQRSHGQCVDEKNKAKSDNKQTEYQNLTVQNLTQESLTSSHGRQPSQEEIECDLQAQELAKELEEKDKKLSEVLRQDPKRMQYMDGIFPNDIDRKSSGVRRSPNGSNYISEKKTSPESNSTNVLPATYFKSPPKALVEMELRMNEEANKELIGDIQDNDALKKQKEELMEKLYVKLDILKEEKMALEQEIMENEALGKRVKQMVEERCRTDHEKQKFFSFIDDLEKIVRLLLNLAGQLARAENAIQSLPENVDPKIRKMTVDKKERLNSKQEDAKRLKEDIDDRSDQVSAFLKERLLPEQFEDYCYYIKMKSKLTIDFQELEDKLTLGDEQIQELRKSIPDK